MAGPLDHADGELTMASRALLSATLATPALATMLSACSDPNAAGKANFRKVIEPLVVDRYCEVVRAAALETRADSGKPAPAWPIVLAREPGLYEQMTRLYARQLLDEAVGRGLVAQTPRVMLARSRDDEPYRRMAVFSYAPTVQGGTSFRSVARGTVGGRPAELPTVCVATGEVRDVIRWTDPAETLGVVLTTVTYTVAGKDVTDVVADPAVRAKLVEPVERTITLQRTNNGWRPFGDR